MTLLDSHVALRIRRQTKRESKNSRKTGPFQSKPRLQRRRSSIEIRCHGVERRFLLQHRWQPPRSSLLRLESAARRSVLKASKFMHRCKIWCHSFRTFQRQTFPKLGNPFLESNRRNRRRCCLSNGQSLLSHCSKHFDEQGPCGMGAFWNNLFAPTLGSWNSASDLRRIRKIVRKIQQIESRSVKGKPLRTHDQWHPEYLGKDAEESHLGFFQSIPLLSLCFPKGEIFRAKKNQFCSKWTKAWKRWSQRFHCLTASIWNILLRWCRPSRSVGWTYAKLRSEIIIFISDSNGACVEQRVNVTSSTNITVATNGTITFMLGKKFNVIILLVSFFET